MADETTAATTKTSPGALLQGGAAAGAWQLDPAATKLEFRVKHFWGAVTVRGQFATVSGRLNVDAGGAVSGRVEADSASLTSGNKQRDKHLRGADFFDVAAHPTVVFTVTGAAAAGDDQLRVTGELTAAGRTQPVSFDARLSEANADRVTVDGEVTVDRRTGFGMTWSPMGIAAPTALLVVKAQFVKSPATPIPA
jgi:polyisoprenoid-binding protein YceI